MAWRAVGLERRQLLAVIILAVMFATSTSLATSVSYQTITMVYGAGAIGSWISLASARATPGCNRRRALGAGAIRFSVRV